MSLRPTIVRRFAGFRNPSRSLATASKQDQILKLPDGRQLGYDEYGSPDGKPLLYFHGYPSSRLEARPAHDMLRRRGIRLIAPDRPGFGLSTPQPGRTLLDWPTDVCALARALGLDRFAVMGLSGGGPFALACAHALPRRMLSAVGLFASGPPWEAGAHQMSRIRQVTSWMATHWPGGLGAGLGASAGALRAVVKSGPGARRLDAWLDVQDAQEEKEMPPGVTRPKATKDERRAELLRVLVDEPLRQGTGAAVLEAKLLSAQDWGFRLEDVDYDPILMWHGAEDKNAPIAMMRYLADKLPHGSLREFPGDSHYTMFKHLDGAFGELCPDGEPEGPSRKE